ncbi:hypothetical protein GZH47_32280 (plasmid) [Paenibacillus rhizovicinus]|uniref:Uncharacterized protein n=1 Tax=Paenibacillus rhizovicinus TaxID=2704463 RepID=A0A6C0PAG3_9BACL|nr:hypothetical protein [Paenibacillus rhizovicinus]QHW35564.1 hypothetical protein GZH47_32280 [Paenibacillus rhizovicinus]
MHPVTTGSIFSIGKPYAAVRVKRKGKNLTVENGGIMIVSADTKFTELPSDMNVISEEQLPIPASGRFLISTETIDPFHIVIDYQKTERV